MPSLLFVYGTLKPTSPEVAAVAGWVEDAVQGDLFDLGPYPGLTNLGASTSLWVEGYTREVNPSELVEILDPYEGVDSGLFSRSLALTRRGNTAWVYTYSREIPCDAVGPLRSWTPSTRSNYATREIESWTNEPRN